MVSKKHNRKTNLYGHRSMLLTVRTEESPGMTSHSAVQPCIEHKDAQYRTDVNCIPGKIMQ
jgi:hypothetical protein